VPRFSTARQVVSWFGAVQAQDFAAAKWALGQRMRQATDRAVEDAFAAGSILRTHVLRPTWHFVAPADIRWMLALTAPRVNAAMASYYRKFALDETVFRRSHRALADALEARGPLTRDELRTAVERAGVPAAGLRFIFMLLRAELDALICSGPRVGGRFTYALLDTRAPTGRMMTRDAALAELARRYVRSHGPATLQDFTWWSGLRRADANAGLDMARRSLVRDVIDGRTYWRSASMPAATASRGSVHLLAPFDEYLVAYADRSAAFDAGCRAQGRSAQFGWTIVHHGRIVGRWTRTPGPQTATVALHPFTALGRTATQATLAAARRYGRFLETPVVVDGGY